MQMAILWLIIVGMWMVKMRVGNIILFMKRKNTYTLFCYLWSKSILLSHQSFPRAQDYKLSSLSFNPFPHKYDSVTGDKSAPVPAEAAAKYTDLQPSTNLQ